MSTNAEKLAKIGLVFAEIFCRLVPKVTKTPDVICGVNRPTFTKIAQNVAKILLFSTPVNRNCDIRIRFERQRVE